MKTEQGSWKEGGDAGSAFEFLIDAFDGVACAHAALVGSVIFILMPIKALTFLQFGDNLVVGRYMNAIFLAIVSVMLFCASIYAGSSDAIIKGKSGTGRTQLELHVGDIEGMVRYLKFTVDGKTIEMKNTYEEKVNSHNFDCVVYDKKNQVYTVYVDGNKWFIKFWLIPGTLKAKYGDGNAHWSFFAYVQGTDPRKYDSKNAFNERTPEIYLYCTLEYNI